ncbi:MAG: alpha-1,4-glucan--maltose-1-phosphate maltosyltransferase [Bryobacterales bacterium]
MNTSESQQGRRRVMIEGVHPEVDAARFPAKRIVGDAVSVEADVFVDGHDAVSGLLLYRKLDSPRWSETPLQPLVNDRWQAEFQAEEIGVYEFTIEAWVDHFKTWRRDMVKRLAAGQAASVDLLIGAELVAAAIGRSAGNDQHTLKSWSIKLRQTATTANQEAANEALSDELAALMDRYPDRTLATRYERAPRIVVDRLKARFSSWYEFFPRSCGSQPGVHGTFADCEARLPYVAGMGFDVLYLPPIHPVGVTFRKGKNNAVEATTGDAGSPWAIGAEQGGHTAIHPQLGTLEDFHRLLRRAKEHGIEIALDIAFQCTPDHPYVRQHPEWFRHRPDGTIQYAENPPKKYQDIYPIDFETENWRELWDELKNVFRFWIEQGVDIFRVDNPHTKSFPFWEEAISEIKRDHPQVLFLSEAFTRPKVRYRLAKLGFSQSYTYFAWRNTKPELTEYLTELTQSPVREFFRPNLWPNTPDILTEYLQHGGRPAFMIRLALAATLGASYGIYGPVYELCENKPREPGSEEYLNSEKYEIRHWDLDHPGSLRDYIARINRIRKENPALQSDWSLRFHPVDNEQLLCYSKQTPRLDSIIVVVVNVEPYHTHSGWIELPIESFGLDGQQPYQVHDLTTDARYLWQGRRNYVELDPHTIPAHIFRIRRRVRTEKDFDYYM